MPIEYRVCSGVNGTQIFTTFKDAYEAIKRNKNIWKLEYKNKTGTHRWEFFTLEDLNEMVDNGEIIYDAKFEILCRTEYEIKYRKMPKDTIFWLDRPLRLDAHKHLIEPIHIRMLLTEDEIYDRFCR